MVYFFYLNLQHYSITQLLLYMCTRFIIFTVPDISVLCCLLQMALRVVNDSNEFLDLYSLEGTYLIRQTKVVLIYLCSIVSLGPVSTSNN